ncbi:MAG: MFS transporter [Candidatus Promineifilaceae bacterium]
MLPKLPAYRVYLIAAGGISSAGMLYGLLTSLYRVQAAGLGPLELILVGTTLELTVLLCEVPTGILADVYGRRLSVIIGYLIIGAGFLVEAFFPTFAMILLAQVIWGLGHTFTSGAREAWLADEIGEERLEAAYLRASQIGRAGGLAALGLGTALGALRLNLPMLAGGALAIGLGLFLALFMPETGFKPAARAERQSWRHLAATFRRGWATVRGRPMLRLMTAITLVYGLSSEGLDRLWEAHLLQSFTFLGRSAVEPAVWFGLIRAVQLALVILATGWLGRRLAARPVATPARVLLLLTLGYIAGLILLGLAPTFGLALAGVWAVAVFRQVSGPLFEAWINRGLPSEVRATVLSMLGQTDAIGQIAGGPPMGLLAQGFGLRAAMVGVGLLLTPAALLYGRALRLLGREPRPAAELRPAP